MIALLSDIHGNLAGLHQVLADIDRQQVSSTICLGDLVDGGPDGAGVVDECRRRGIRCIRGNHDVCNADDLGEDRQAWLDRLPDQIVEGDTIFTHISPRRIRVHKVRDIYEAWNVFEETPWRRIFVGHTHISAIFSDRSPLPTEAVEVPIRFNQWMTLEADCRYVVSVGAVGYSRDARHTIRWGFYAPERQALLIREEEGPMIASSSTAAATAGGRRPGRQDAVARAPERALPRILVLCLGNRCRSPILEAILRRDGDGVLSVRSGGFSDESAGRPVEARARRLLVASGYQPRERAHRVDAADVAWADHIVVVDRDTERRFRGEFGDAKPVALLARFSGEDQDVEDPVDPAAYAIAFATLCRHAAALIAALRAR